MATARELTDPYVSTYVPVPHVGPGVCEVCHSWTARRPDGSHASRCPSCERTTRQVTHPLHVVVPISLTRIDMHAQLHNVLRDYKAEHLAEAVRAQHRLQVAALLVRFLSRHREHITASAGGDWNTIVDIPSTRGRAGTHPLVAAIDLTALRDEHASVLQPTGAEVGHNQASDQVYTADPVTAGRRILLVDDTFTTGARLQSAASALTAAGANVVAAVVLGRVVRPDYNSEAKALWAQQSAIPFDFEACCLE